MAPEYALRGQLTEKADVYSFGIVAMEIVSGRSTVKKKGSADDVPLINWVTMDLLFGLVDSRFTLNLCVFNINYRR